MVSPAVGSVILITFLFSDLSSSKLRPAIVIASSGRDDWIQLNLQMSLQELSP